MTQPGLSFIGYQRSTGKDHAFQAINPSTGDSLEPTFFAATPAEVERAAQLAHRAFLNYKNASGAKKAAFLRSIADNIDSKLDTIVERATAETGLPEMRIKGETARTTGQLRLFASLVEEGSWVNARIDTALPDRQPLPKPDVRCMLRPMGPVVVFGASNFPMAFSVAGGDTASALAAGCPVIVKAHHSHPGTASIVAEAILEAARGQGLPEGIFSMVFGPGRSIGQALVAHPLVKAVGFTGSRAGGQALMKVAFEREVPIPVYAEMSSVNPVFLLPGAFQGDLDALAQGLFGSATLGVGQFCTNPGLVFFEPNATTLLWADKFKAAMAAGDSGIMLNPGIRDAYAEGVESRRGVDGVEASIVPAFPKESGCAVPPTVFEVKAEDFLKQETLAEEIFGPETLLVHTRGETDLLQVAENLEGQLTASVFGSEQDFANNTELISILERKAGRVIFNGFPTGVEVCHSMVHGGPYPALSDGRSTSVGTFAIERFCRLVAFQNAPEAFLPDELRSANPLDIQRLVNGEYSK